MSHGRGDPATEVGRTLHATPISPAPGVREAHPGSGSPRTARASEQPPGLRAGREPLPGGRGGQADAACPGNMDRTMEGRPPRSTFLPGIAKTAHAHPRHRFGNLSELRHEA
jgi:hypothetical protein